MAALDHTVTVELPPMETATDGRPNPMRVYRIAGMGPGVRSAWVRVVKDRAWAELDSQAERMPVSRYNRMEASLMREMAAGMYEWQAEIHQTIDGTKAGMTAELLARLRVGTSNPDLHPSIIDELIDRYGYGRLMKLVAQSDGPSLPNGQTPESKPGENLTTNKSEPQSAS